jgi:hypothetical protein
MTRELYPWKANGQLRYTPSKGSAEQKKKCGRSRVTNGRDPFRGTGATARRLRDLVQIHGEGLPDNETTRGLLRDVASASVELERMQGAITRDEPIDRLEFTRLSGVRRRNLTALAAMKAQASPLPPAEIEGAAGLARLRSRLAEIAAKG